ncbi:uncharacterized protein LOC143469567 [Clavelina lepadiformis]|uniref:uncharacterized protein LOC143469567 n=1 Tax=Clavelina lepadiformis TaxID=159417 RepID=UPI004042195E
MHSRYRFNPNRPARKGFLSTPANVGVKPHPSSRLASTMAAPQVNMSNIIYPKPCLSSSAESPSFVVRYPSNEEVTASQNGAFHHQSLSIGVLHGTNSSKHPSVAIKQRPSQTPQPGKAPTVIRTPAPQAPPHPKKPQTPGPRSPPQPAVVNVPKQQRPPPIVTLAQSQTQGAKMPQTGNPSPVNANKTSPKKSPQQGSSGSAKTSLTPSQTVNKSVPKRQSPPQRNQPVVPEHRGPPTRSLSEPHYSPVKVMESYSNQSDFVNGSVPTAVNCGVPAAQLQPPRYPVEHFMENQGNFDYLQEEDNEDEEKDVNVNNEVEKDEEEFFDQTEASTSESSFDENSYNYSKPPTRSPPRSGGSQWDTPTSRKQATLRQNSLPQQASSSFTARPKRQASHSAKPASILNIVQPVASTALGALIAGLDPSRDTSPRTSPEELSLFDVVSLYSQLQLSCQTYNIRMVEASVGLDDNRFEVIHHQEAADARRIFESARYDIGQQMWRDRKAELEDFLKIERERFKEFNRTKRELNQEKEKVRSLQDHINRLKTKDKMGPFWPPEKIKCILSREGLLGKGGFGSVRLAFVGAHGAVAIKCLALTGARQDIEAAESKIKAEIEMLRKASHKNVVRTFGYTRWPDALGILMEYMAGGSLYTLLLGKKRNGYYQVPHLPGLILLRICTDVACGVAFLHHDFESKRMTHGDLKPHNVLLTADLQCKIADFGGADLATCTTTSTLGLINGTGTSHEYTPMYSAPERLENTTARPRKAMDVYSTGLIFHAALSREAPFPRHMKRNEIVRFVCNGNRPEVDMIERHIERLDDEDEVEIFELIQDEMKKCWRQEPKERPTMAEVKENLQRLLSSQDMEMIRKDVDEIMQYMKISAKTISAQQYRCGPVEELIPPSFTPIIDI